MFTPKFTPVTAVTHCNNYRIAFKVGVKVKLSEILRGLNRTTGININPWMIIIIIDYDRLIIIRQ